VTKIKRTTQNGSKQPQLPIDNQLTMKSNKHAQYKCLEKTYEIKASNFLEQKIIVCTLEHY